jgi:hypothetical protein
MIGRRIWRARATCAAGVLLLAGLMAGCGSSSTSNGSSTSAAATGTGSAGSASASELAPVHGAYKPSIDPTNFVATIDNRYFPLKPGTTFLYKGVAENGTTPQTDEMVVTHRIKQIMGVKCTVIRDTVSSHGTPIERTFDWYAQDEGGNVWYMGEDTREVRNGRFVKQSDSWEGGVDGAQPGIIMPGDPQSGDEYRQEYYPGHALDEARVLGSGGAVSVPYGSFPSSLATVETSPQIDPGVAERKYYVAGLGDVWEHTVSGNHEQIKLVRVTH